MISRILKLTLLILFALAGGAGLVALRLDNSRLARQIADQRRMNEQAVRSREENRRLRELMDHAQATGAAAAETRRTDLERTRAEVAALEERATAAYAQVVAKQKGDAEALATNHDPTKGLARLDYFQNVGQATPTDAFQTFIWAALKGDLDAAASIVKIDETARDAAAALITSLPEADRAKFPTPERLAALFFTDAFTNMTAAQIIGVTNTDATHATLAVGGLTEKIQKVPLQLGPGGWQIVVPPGLVRNLAGWTGAKTPPSGK